MYGIASYGLIGTGIYLQNKAKENYESYKNSFTHSESGGFYQTAVNQRNLSYIAIGAGTCIWTLDIAFIIKKARNVKKNPIPEKSKYYHQLANKEFVLTTNTIAFDNRTEFDIALENAAKLIIDGNEQIKTDEALALKTFENAKNQLSKALSIKPNHNEAKSQQEYVASKIASIKDKQNKYDQTIAEADRLLTTGNIDAAELEYNKAKQIYPNNSYPETKLQQIKQRREAERIQAEYDGIIAKANKLLVQGNLDEAKINYQTALTLKPQESYPKTKIHEIEQIINDRDYKEAIVQADKAFDNKQFDLAKSYYEKAKNLKPNETYPKNRIASINKMLEVNIPNPQVSSNGNPFYEKNKNAVFKIELPLNNSYSTSQGTGFLISSNGIAISNFHVFENCNWRNGTVSINGETFSIAELLAYNGAEDYVIFRIQTSKSLPYLSIAKTLPKVNRKGFCNWISRGANTELFRWNHFRF
ncbi:MAG: hypothetical protein IPO21_07245 [Bacteroidales bacterium]|nr:hypothetical protein [Bacteroidales bacterium]